ncbi:RsmB/NOP family class I SAM-dependent RNA methyltransferase [Aestuariivita sp.]|jgi:16S rRNA (cytosine967-C5)-methyltransferase|uniref:RsmB/NOP family class I SAM-dependent RNA methyltransferase n=1 Tax=Aestuariivita sp. TaxID=1872407 RepID=UPI00217179A3|nr:RsmB/NOP family class I SAM-dependent RNA methyltransferase [Aestuariivita sp.]MCE8007245.1 16S rRNA methyltransferase [Aestuariivita sp.]
MAETGVAARRSAIYLLDQILGEGRLMSELLASGALERLAPDDRARAQRLAQDVLRGLERADRLLSKHLRKSPPLTVRNALRLGTVELCQGGAAHGVVHSLVTIVAAHRRHGQLKGLVNAVLRKMADQGSEAWGTLRVPRLPKWLRVPLVEAWGTEGVAAMERAQFAGAPVDLTVKSAPETWAEALGAEVLPTGSLRLRRDAGQISALPGFEQGAWWVQDAAAAIPVRCLDPRPGERVIDLCAAPGGKTLQIAASGAVTVAVDLSDARMARVRDNLARTRLEADLRVGDAQSQQGQYDAVLLDAPCSATGTIRRHPDLPYAKDGSDFMALFETQRQLIDHAWTLLRPGGRLVYCTCSLLPDEGEVQLEEALARLPGAATDRQALERPGLDPAWITPEGGLRLRPDFWADRGGMDGFYIAVLRKPASGEDVR